MSLKDKLMSSSPGEINELNNWAFATSIGAYQLYGQFVLNPTITSLAVFGVAATVGLAAEIIYLVRPVIKRVYQP